MKSRIEWYNNRDSFLTFQTVNPLRQRGIKWIHAELGPLQYLMVGPSPGICHLPSKCHLVAYPISYHPRLFKPFMYSPQLIWDNFTAIDKNIQTKMLSNRVNYSLQLLAICIHSLISIHLTSVKYIQLWELIEVDIRNINVVTTPTQHNTTQPQHKLNTASSKP